MPRWLVAALSGAVLSTLAACAPGRAGGGGAPCGAASAACCTGDVCNAGLTCQDAVCAEPCGAAGQVCCNGSTCSNGLTCAGGLCGSVLPPDSGSPDSGPDGGATDAGQEDAGPFDAGEIDAGSFDAGEIDAGEIDAGGPDAGTTSPDAGPADAGPATPIPCSSQADCAESAQTPACLPTQGICVACLTTLDCPGTLWCNGSFQCVSEPSFPCSGNSDCFSQSGTPVCDPFQGICVPCLYNGDCSPGQVCNQNEACESTPATESCGSDTDCLDPGAWYCDTLRGTCVECTMSGNGDCPGPDICLAETCAASVPACTTDSDCAAVPGATVCDQAQDICVECLVNTDCPTGAACGYFEVCEAAPPVQSCTSDGDCFDAAALYCDPGSLTCVQCTLSGQGQCQGPDLCQNDLCVLQLTTTDGGPGGTNADGGS